MLRSISWSQFITFLLFGILIYYAYFVWVCHEAGLLRFFFKDRATGKMGASKRSAASADSEIAVAAGSVSAGEGHLAGDQDNGAKRLEMEKNVSAAGMGYMVGDKLVADTVSMPIGTEKGEADSSNEAKGMDKSMSNVDAESKALLQTADMAIMHVKQVVDEGIGSGISWEEIKERLHMVLSACQTLRGTPHVATVNSFIERNCRASFALVLSEKDLQQLWGGGQTEQTIKTL